MVILSLGCAIIDAPDERGGSGLFVVALGIYDRRHRGRVHPVTLWGGLALMLSFPGRLALGKTEQSRDVAACLIQ